MSIPLADILKKLNQVFETQDEATLNKTDFIRLLIFKNVPHDLHKSYMQSGYQYLKGKKIKCGK